MECCVVAEFLLTSASRGPSAIAEPLVTGTRRHTSGHTNTSLEMLSNNLDNGLHAMLYNMIVTYCVTVKLLCIFVLLS